MQPSLLDRELADMFMDTLQSPYFRMMVGSASLDFYDLVKVGEHIESGLKRGKF